MMMNSQPAQCRGWLHTMNAPTPIQMSSATTTTANPALYSPPKVTASGSPSAARSLELLDRLAHPRRVEVAVDDDLSRAPPRPR